MGRPYIRVKDSSPGHLLLIQPEGGADGKPALESQKQAAMLDFLHVLLRRSTPDATPAPLHRAPARAPPSPRPPLGLLLRRVEPLIIDFLFSLTFLPPLAAVPPNLSGPDRTERCCGRRALKDRLDCLGLLPYFSYLLLRVLPPM